jgi:PilZ domain
MSAFTKESTTSRFKRIWRERNFKRAFERHRCNLDVTMLSPPRMTSLSGRMIDISRGGGMFRPCLTYLVDRRGAEAFIIAADVKIPVRIVRTLACGYALQFIDILSDEDLLKIRNASPQLEEAA